MKIEFDGEKDAANRAKHGISLCEAEQLDWSTLWAEQDKRTDYGEQRMVGYVIKGTRLYCVVYTSRGENRRIISLRKANKREVIHYANNN